MNSETFRNTINKVESKIMPINQVDHRFRLESLTFGMEGITLHARLLTSNEQDFTIEALYSYASRTFAHWTMRNDEGVTFQVVGIVSKTLYTFARRATLSIIEALGYEINE
jgi:hypothetical protein